MVSVLEMDRPGRSQKNAQVLGAAYVSVVLSKVARPAPE